MNVGGNSKPSTSGKTLPPPTKSKPTLTKPQLMKANSNVSMASTNNSTCASSIAPTNHKIVLTSAEEELFEVLTSAALQYEKAQSISPIAIRVAGGWVRDKVLNLYSHDVDIAIDCMSGVQFATIVKKELDKVEDPKKHKMGVISANPEQSKHLETATMKIHGIEVDFVHLRGQEVYEEHSRIPTQLNHFGTPLDDAMRRDFTINSLFYNVRTKCIEDFTKRGMDDLLVRKLIETPICPHITFKDDPLRVLRAIRFGVRYDFSLADDLREAAMSKDVKKSLMIKVSRERVGKELEGMLVGKGAKPLVAFGLIIELGLGDSVFCHPEGVEIIDHDDVEDVFNKGWAESQKFMKELPVVLKEVEDSKIRMESNESETMMTETEVDVRMLHISTLLLPFADLKYIDRKKKKVLVVEWMLREGIKFKNKDISAIRTLSENLPSMVALLKQVRKGSNPNSFCRLQTGLLLRELKDLWVTCLLLATISDMANNPETATKSLQACIFIYKSIFQQKLDGSWKTRPLVDGKALIKLLDLPKGPLVGEYLNEQVRWMLLYPQGNKEECEEYLKKKKLEKERSTQ